MIKSFCVYLFVLCTWQLALPSMEEPLFELKVGRMFLRDNRLEADTRRGCLRYLLDVEEGLSKLEWSERDSSAEPTWSTVIFPAEAVLEKVRVKSIPFSMRFNAIASHSVRMYSVEGLQSHALRCAWAHRVGTYTPLPVAGPTFPPCNFSNSPPICRLPLTPCRFLAQGLASLCSNFRQSGTETSFSGPKTPTPGPTTALSWLSTACSRPAPPRRAAIRATARTFGPGARGEVPPPRRPWPRRWQQRCRALVGPRPEGKRMPRLWPTWRRCGRSTRRCRCPRSWTRRL